MIYARRDSDRDNWQHMHHYCDCVRFTDRALATMGNKYDFKYNLQIAIGGCDYVLSHTTPDFNMRPEVLVTKGKALRLFNKDAEAAVAFTTALQMNPNYAPAYYNLAALYDRQGNKKMALEVVTNGLKRVSGSKALQRRYVELGGKLPYPAPEQVPEAAEARSDQALPEGPSLSSQADTPADTKTETNSSTSADMAAQPPPPSSPTIGSPANPWCRFCPPPELQQPGQAPSTP